MIRSQEAYIKASNNGSSDKFGTGVALSADTLAVGAHLEASNQTTITNGTSSSTDNSNTDSGAVYIYKRTGTSWEQEAYVKASNGEASDNFGQKLALADDTLVVGVRKESSNQTTITNGTAASSHNSSSSAGAAYVYRKTGALWAQEAYIKAGNAEASDLFGSGVALHAETLAVGATQEDGNETTITNGTTSSTDNSTSSSGAVYIYTR